MLCDLTWEDTSVSGGSSLSGCVYVSVSGYVLGLFELGSVLVLGYPS